MPRTTSNRRETAPAEGERRAIGGYGGQYQVAAWLILQQLNQRELQGIRVADPEAGKVDDIQIFTANRIDAYQVKWSRTPATISFNGLTSATSDSMPLIQQLAEGWSTLKQLHPTKRIVVHLVTNDRPSGGDTPPTGDRPPSPNNFSAFYSQVWNVVRGHANSEDVIPEEWKTAWAALCEASTLDDATFNKFIKDCELDLDFHLPPSVSGDRDNANLQEDIQHIKHALFDTVQDPARIIELDLNTLVSRLGWRDRIELIGRHEFPVDADIYRPITLTVSAVENCIATLAGGYIALLGAPGSGKSTLLTQTLRYRPSERVIRYYAYVPDTQGPANLRGESVNFLHDVVMEIERAGFIVGQSMSRFDRDQLLQRFLELLTLLHTKVWTVQSLSSHVI